MPADPLLKVRVWDLPTRIFHWLLALCFAGLVITGRIGGDAMGAHSWLGYTVASLLLFRLVWGFAGGHWSRFRSFAYPPSAVLDHLKGAVRPLTTVGHSPLGAISVYALLLFLGAQVGTGLFSENKADFAGPLNRFVSGATARSLTGYHKNVGQTVLISLVALHLAAIAYYRVRGKKDLVRPMLHGNKMLGPDLPASRDDNGSRLAALALWAACIAVVAFTVVFTSG